MDVASRSADWLGGVVDLMREPTTAVPVAAVLGLLRHSFETAMASWNWFEADGSFGMVIDPAEVPILEPQTLERWQTGELFEAHALLQWLRVTGDLRPQTTARVPTRVCSRRRRGRLERELAQMEMEHQLTVVYDHGGPAQRAFIVARGGTDFTDDDLALAEVVQHSLLALHHQALVMQRLTELSTGTDLGLTARELAVLQLVAEGLPTRRVARVLRCSPRTVEKHLENAFRRLGVRDRLNAVRVLQLAGVLGARPLPDHEAVVAPGAYRGLGLHDRKLGPTAEPDADRLRELA